MLAALAVHAMGSVRLQVTGKPPTISAFALAFEHDHSDAGSDAAARPCRKVLRSRKCLLNRFSGAHAQDSLDFVADSGRDRILRGEDL